MHWFSINGRERHKELIWILEICIKILRKPDLVFYNLICQYKGFQIPNLDEIRHKMDLFKKKRLKKCEEFRISLWNRKNQFVLSWAIVRIFRCPVDWLPLKFCHKESHGILSYWYDWPIGILTLETSASNEILAGLPHTNNHVKGRGGGA